MSPTRQNMRIMLVGGGSGGHFYPLIGIAEVLERATEKPRLYYAGPDPYDAASLERTGISFVYIPAGKRRRYFSLRNYVDIFKTLFGFFLALIKLYVIFPDVIVSKGGYTSVPVILAAAFYRIPIIVHESDAVMGSANKLAARFARTIVLTYAETPIAAHTDVRVLGIPIRSALLPSASVPPSASGLDGSRPVLLIIGGSQGAVRINELIFDSLDELLPTYDIIHQTGKENYELAVLTAEKLIPDPELRKHYHLVPFLSAEELKSAYQQAKLVISRAGTTSIYEIALHGKPSIIIPIPEEVSHDQRKNAYAYARFGGTTVMEESNLTDSLLQAEIERIMQNEELYSRMAEGARSFAKEDAAEKIAALVLERAHEH